MDKMVFPKVENWEDLISIKNDNISANALLILTYNLFNITKTSNIKDESTKKEVVESSTTSTITENAHVFRLPEGNNLGDTIEFIYRDGSYLKISNSMAHKLLSKGWTAKRSERLKAGRSTPEVTTCPIEISTSDLNIIVKKIDSPDLL